jgi:hypothetical protein
VSCIVTACAARRPTGRKTDSAVRAPTPLIFTTGESAALLFGAEAEEQMRVFADDGA